jgi:hypothetical protein
MAKATEISVPLLAYTDETGNSGLNLFDSGQPFFWTGTLITSVDLDGLNPAIHRACLSRVGRDELHGNELGFSGIEKVAGKLQQLLYRYGIQFIFTRLAKSHLAGTKFADTLLDSGLNRAVSNIHYGVRFNRLYLAHIVIALLDRTDREEFWAAYATGGARPFVAILSRLEVRVESDIPDPRTRQLLLDAIRWAKQHPEPLVEGTRSELDSPNVVALSLLINVLHELSRHDNVTIGTFVHDEQKQFAKWLKLAYDVSKNFTSRRGTSPLALMIDLQDMETFGCDFRMASSRTSFGLQILDVALWLTKRFIDKPEAVQGKCRELAEYISKTALISEFTQEALLREVMAGFMVLNSTPLSSAQEQRGRELVAQFEAQRLARIHALDEAPSVLIAPANEVDPS